MFLFTVSTVFSSRFPFRHQVIVAGGREPEDWQIKSYRRAADRGWLAPRIFTVNGPTATAWCTCALRTGFMVDINKFCFIGFRFYLQFISNSTVDSRGAALLLAARHRSEVCRSERPRLLITNKARTLVLSPTWTMAELLVIGSPLRDQVTRGVGLPKTSIKITVQIIIILGKYF